MFNFDFIIVMIIIIDNIMADDGRQLDETSNQMKLPLLLARLVDNLESSR